MQELGRIDCTRQGLRLAYLAVMVWLAVAVMTALMPKGTPVAGTAPYSARRFCAAWSTACPCSGVSLPRPYCSGDAGLLMRWLVTDMGSEDAEAVEVVGRLVGRRDPRYLAFLFYSGG